MLYVATYSNDNMPFLIQMCGGKLFSLKSIRYHDYTPVNIAFAYVYSKIAASNNKRVPLNSLYAPIRYMYWRRLGKLFSL